MYKLWYKHIMIIMMPLESSVSDTTIWSVTLELSTTILGVSYTLSYDVFSKNNTYENHQLTILRCL
jgi:hypothetical protein